MAGRCLWIADKLRAYGLRVVEVQGWERRGAATMKPGGVVVHHDALPSSVSAARAVGLMVEGRPDLPGPLCHVWLDDDADDTARKGDPVAYVIASGRAHHAGRGGYRGLSGNSSVLGIEARNNGRGEEWSPAMLAAYHRCAAALLDGIGRDESWVCAHREWTPRKPDPAGVDMGRFRAQVGHLLAPPPAPVPPLNVDYVESIMRIIKAPNGAHARIEGGTFYLYGTSDADNAALFTDALWLLGQGIEVQLVSYDQWNYEKRTRARMVMGPDHGIVSS